MDEKDFFNRDVMYWREVNTASPGLNAQIEFIKPFEINGDLVNEIACILLPFETAEVVYEMENGGAFKKNEVISWLFVQNGADADFYKDKSNTEEARKTKVKTVEHSNVESITLIEDSGTVLLKKAKI
jgi:hypothetical protein